jgi:hypothetical protein
VPARGASANIAIQSECLRAGVKRGAELHIDIPTLAEFKQLAQIKG